MSDNSVDVSEDEEQLAAAVSRDMQDMEHARSEQAKNLKEVRKAIVQREDELENNEKENTAAGGSNALGFSSSGMEDDNQG